uniref:Coiled-coil domain containing 65 n=1 Tax=Varanus komodoensis TaxID=61221 RepID=A0A8D2KSM7_VARKO
LSRHYVAPNFSHSLHLKTKSYLASLSPQAELILRLAEMCRRLESEEEKVLPFYASSLSWDEQKVADKVAMEKPVEPLAEMMQDYVGLERFWKRYNKVRLEQLSLERTKEALLQDNLKLRRLLKQYLDGISVNEEVLSQINPLVIVNQQTVAPSRPQPVPVGEAQVKRPVYNVIEAAHEVSHIL